MANEVEIHVRVTDKTAAGAGSVKRSGEKAGKDFGDGVDDGIRKSKGGDADVGGLAKRILGSLKSTLGAGQPLALTLGTAFSTQFIGAVASGLASGAAKVAHGLGASLALLPAIAATAAVGLATVKIALAGVGDALKAGLSGDTEKFNEALKEMAPSARTFARGLVSLKDELKDLKSEVQGNFFAPFAESVRPLGEMWLPILKSELGGVASSFGGVGKQFASWAQQPRVVVGIAGALGNMRTVLGNVAGGVMGLVRAFLPLITVGSTFLPGLTHGFGSATDQLARFMEQAERTGKLRQWISDGLSKIGDLVDTGQQVWRIFRNIGDIGEVVFQGLGFKTGGLLDSLERLTEKARDFFHTAEGGQAATTIFETLRSVVNSLFGSLQALSGTVIKSFGPLLPMIAEFLEAFASFKLALLDALVPIAAVITRTVLPPLTKLLDFITGNQAALVATTAVVTALFAAWAVGSAVAAAKGVGDIGKMINGIKALHGAVSGLSGAGVAAGIVGIGAAFMVAFDQIDKARKSANLQRLAEEFSATGAGMDELFEKAKSGNLWEFVGVFTKLRQMSPEVAEAFIDQAEAAGVADDMIAKMRNGLADTVSAQQAAADAAEDAKSAVEKEADAVSAFNDSLDKMLGKTLDVPEAQAAFTQALAATADQMARQTEEFGANATSMDVNTEAGAANTEMIAGLVRAGADVLTSMRDQGASSADLRSEQERQIDSIRRVAGQLGLERGAVDRLIEGLMAIPSQRRTEIQVSRGAAMAAIAAVQSAINNLHGKTVTVRVTATGAGAGLLGGFLGQAHGGIVGAARGIGRAATGGPRTGWTWVGEQGPELAQLPPGTQVKSHGDSMRMGAGGGGGSEVVLRYEGSGNAAIDALINMLLPGMRMTIQRRYGGDVNAALGYSRR